MEAISIQPTEVYVDDEAKLRLTNMQQYYISLKEHGKDKQLLRLLDELEFNQVSPVTVYSRPAQQHAAA